MAHNDADIQEKLVEWSGLVSRYLESLIETGQRRAEVPPEVLRAWAAGPALPSASGANAAPGKKTRGPAGKAPERELDEIAREIASCTRCPLHAARNRTVPGEGSPNPEILFVGEGPGAEEDRRGVPFVGPAGHLLTRLIEAMGFQREDVFIANIVKCRATVDGAGKRDRPPSPEEMAVCLPYLKKQISVLRPRVMVLLGNVALEGLFGFRGITKRRGHWLEYHAIPAMPTYHPSYLLRGGGENKARYWDVWDDMCEVLRRIGRRPLANKQRPAKYGGKNA